MKTYNHSFLDFNYSIINSNCNINYSRNKIFLLTLCSRSSILYVRSRIFKKGGMVMETLINRGYKFKIVPTKEQKEFFLQSFGCARKNIQYVC